MKIRRFFNFLLKVLLLLVTLFFVFIFSNTVINPLPNAEAPTPEEAGEGAIVLLFICLLNALIWYVPLLRARWRGVTLVGAIVVLYFGINSLMPQLDTLFFESAFEMPEGTVYRILFSGLLQAVLFAPLAVSIVGKWKSSGPQPTQAFQFEFSPSQWMEKVGGLVVLYVVIYFLFGYFVAWQSPAVRMFYSGSETLKSFTEHFSDLFSNSFSLVIFQFFRGLLWVGLAVLFIKMGKGNRLIVAISLALLFGVLPTSQLLLPNPLMPGPVRWMHFWETMSSMVLFGFISGWVLTSSQSAKLNDNDIK